MVESSEADSAGTEPSELVLGCCDPSDITTADYMAQYTSYAPHGFRWAAMFFWGGHMLREKQRRRRLLHKMAETQPL